MAGDSDEHLAKEYLLGRLPEAERLRAQERLLADEDFHTCLLAVEEDLLDLYVRNLLEEEDRKQVEAHLLAVWGSERIAFARAFTKTSVKRRGHLSFSTLSLAAAVICAVAAVWMWSTNRALVRSLDARQGELIEARRTAAEQPAVTLLLSPSRRRGAEAEKEVLLTGESELVHFELELEEPPRSGGVSVRIQDQSGGTIWQQEKLTARSVGSGAEAALVADLWMPASLLSPGSYVVSAGEDEYRIVVRRK
jgi:anti-sigma-K factor RskA